MYDNSLLTRYHFFHKIDPGTSEVLLKLFLVATEGNSVADRMVADSERFSSLREDQR
jgi:hypothetical protein